MSSILACGDTHGDHRTIQDALYRAEGCDWVVQVGDFGYWEQAPGGSYFLNTCSRLSERYGVPIVFLDGNHENHPLLWERYADSEKTPEGFWTIRPGVHYAPRGHRWNWYGKRFLALGGAYSIDRAVRSLGKSYWLEEEITPEDADRACEGGPVDVMFSHDAPISMNPLGANSRRFQDSAPSRVRLERVVENVRPTLLVHGHWHVRYSDRFTHRDGFVTQVEGLAADGHKGTTLKLDFKENT